MFVQRAAEGCPGVSRHCTAGSGETMIGADADKHRTDGFVAVALKLSEIKHVAQTSPRIVDRKSMGGRPRHDGYRISRVVHQRLMKRLGQGGGRDGDQVRLHRPGRLDGYVEECGSQSVSLPGRVCPQLPESPVSGRRPTCPTSPALI